ncbi:hypothetical protein PY793_13530 [Acetobacter fabarum]|uniref:hypothetical protein n=1 Tax=Acetobacter fabarum TaxID=483199 RepID=UPI00312B2E53
MNQAWSSCLSGCVDHLLVGGFVHIGMWLPGESGLMTFQGINPVPCKPGVRAAINSNDKRKAVRIIKEQVRAKGKVMNGLVRRQHDEAMLLLAGRY